MTTVSNKYLRQLEERRSQDLATLSQLSRDLDAHIRGKQAVRTRVPAKYVGLTNAQGDSQYRANLARFGAKNLGRAFGVNMSLQELHDDTRRELAAYLGSGKALAAYVDLCTQTVIHVIAQAAARMEAPDSTQLEKAYSFMVKSLTASSGSRAAGNLTTALQGLNGLNNFSDGTSNTLFKDKVFRYLSPINRSYIEALVAINLSKIEARADMLAYIDNDNAKNAANSYLVKRKPGGEVLLPGSISSGQSAKDAFAAYPSKDVVATFEYYRAAVESEMDSETGIRTGDVEASLTAAKTALLNAAGAMSLTGIPKAQSQIFEKGFRSLAKSIGSLKPKGLGREDVAFQLAELFDLLGAYAEVGGGKDKLGANEIKSVFSNAPDGFQTLVEDDILSLTPSAYIQESGLAQKDIAFLDAQDEVRPENILVTEKRKPNLAAVRNNISLAILSLTDAAAEISTGLTSSISGRPDVGEGLLDEPKVTDQFKELVLNNLTSVQNRFKTLRSNASVDSSVYSAAINELYAQVIGVTVDSDANPLSTSNSDLAKSPENWIITNARFEQLADGRVPNLKSRTAGGRTIEQVLVSYVNTQFANADARVSADVRRATRDAVLQSAQLLSDVLEGVRIQAENIGMVVRQNPMGGDMSGLAVTGTVTASLVGTHALSALTNHIVSPKHGTAMSHVVDLAPSLLVAGTGVYLAQAKGEKDLGYSLAGGAAGHLALRYLMKHVPALRFSENIGAKILQAPTNGLAHLLGDDTMGASGLTPANAQSHKDAVADYICELVCENSKEALNYIAIQLWQSGLRAGDCVCAADGVRVTFTVQKASKLTRDKIKDDDAACAEIGKICSALACLKYACDQDCKFTCKNGNVNAECTLNAKQIAACNQCAKKCAADCAKILGCSAVATSDAVKTDAVSIRNALDALKTAIEASSDSGAALSGRIKAAVESSKSLTAQDKQAYLSKNMEGVSPAGKAAIANIIMGVVSNGDRSNPMHMNGFILEPGYNMDVYSGEDQVSYLQPAPQMTSQSGFVQLEDAIARSEELGPHDKMMEGIGDLQDVAILRAAPSDARMIEGSGMGVSLGQSRQNPSAELVALEVEGDNGLMSVAPQRQHSVPQGALNYAKIGHAPDVDVSPHGLFNRGAFSPNFGR